MNMNMNAPTEVTPQGYDFTPALARIKQQRALADLLRKQDYSKQPEGEMIGNRYVGPSITQRLAPIVGALGSAYQQTQADRGEQDFTRQTGDAARKWQSSLPQAIAATQDPPQDIGGNMVQGPVMPGSMPSREAVLKATMQGLQIPGNEKAAELWNRGMGDEITREDTQTARKEDRQATIEAARQNKLDQLEAARQNKLDQLEFQRQQLEAQMTDKRLSREQLDAYQKMHDATLRAIAVGQNEARKAATDAAATARETAQTAITERRTADKVEHLSRRAEPAVQMMSSAQQVQDMIDNYTDPKTGKVKPMPGIGLGIGALTNALLTEEGSDNRQKFRMFQNAMVRAQAGLSQTLSEQENANLELLVNGKATQAQMLNAWKNLQIKVNSTPKVVRAGYDNEVLRIFDERKGGLNEVKSRHKPIVVPTAPTAPGAPKGEKTYNPATGMLE
jgi:hypothetical protein